MNKNIAFLTMGFWLIPLCVFSEIKTDPSVAAVFSKGTVRPAIYKIAARDFSQSDALAKLNYLKSLNFSYTVKNDTGKAAFYKNELTGQILSYSPDKSEYRYQDPGVSGFTVTETIDTAKLHIVADGHLRNLMGIDSSNFKFTNNEFEYIMEKGKDNTPRLNSLTYRYIRVLDGRPVKGISCQAFITLGNNGKLSRFKSNNPTIEKASVLSRQIKNAAMNKYLQNYLAGKKYTEDPNGNVIPINNTMISKSWETYFAKDQGGIQYLVPHMSFFTVDSLTDGTTMRREFHIPVDADQVENVDPNDAINYVGSK
jgi:hypothetical protein